MLKIVRTLDNRWGIYAPSMGLVMEPAQFEEMIDQCKAIGVRAESLEAAFNDLRETGHNCAEFGVNINDGSLGFIFCETVTIIERRTGGQEILRLSDKQFETAVLMGGQA